MNIAILASGGDGPGMNMFLYTLVKKLKKHNITLFEYGYKGLIEDKTCDFDLKYLKSQSGKGGILVKTSRCEEFQTISGQEKALETLKKHKIDVLFVLGGNGSLAGAKSIKGKGVKIVFVPCSIDNDVFPSTYAIGFDSACGRCKEYIDSVKDTMQSFDRVCVYEVMGRDHDAIANKVSKMVSADFTYTKNSTLQNCVDALKKAKTKAPQIVLQENVLDVKSFSSDLETALNREVKYCVVGYFQRGGKPSKFETKMAKMFACACAKAVNSSTLYDLTFCQYDEKGEISLKNN